MSIMIKVPKPELPLARARASLSLRTVRTIRYKLTLDLISDAVELYDLESDSDEMKYLFDQLQASTVQQQLFKMIHSRPDDMHAVKEPVGVA